MSEESREVPVESPAGGTAIEAPDRLGVALDDAARRIVEWFHATSKEPGTFEEEVFHVRGELRAHLNGVAAPASERAPELEALIQGVATAAITYGALVERSPVSAAEIVGAQDALRGARAKLTTALRAATLGAAQPEPVAFPSDVYSLAEILGDEVDAPAELDRLARACEDAARSALEEGAKLRHEVSEGVTPHAEVDATLAAAREWDGTYHDMRKIALLVRRTLATSGAAQPEPLWAIVNSTRPGIGIADACEVVTLCVPRPCALKSGDEVSVRLVQARLATSGAAEPVKGDDTPVGSCYPPSEPRQPWEPDPPNEVSPNEGEEWQR